ncbi:MAG TPA: PGDYG domain-containing protein, partial [Burkholderiaceae bacterium]
RDDKGRQWRVSRHHFEAKYELLDGERFRSRRIEVKAQQLGEPFEVLLADQRSLLRGTAGDWLVDYGDGSLGVVSDTAFASSYDLLD